MKGGSHFSTRRVLTGLLVLAVALCLTVFFFFPKSGHSQASLQNWNAATGSLVAVPSLPAISSGSSLSSSAQSVVTLLASSASHVSAASGILINYPYEHASLSSARPEPGSVRIPIFMYHYLEVVRNPKDALRVRLAVTPTIFEEQLVTLQKNGFHTLFVRDIPAMLTGSLKVSRPLVLTFDDGYEDFYTDAYPLLMKYQVHATLFVINDFIGKSDYLTEAQIQEMVATGLVEIGAHTLDHLDLRTLSIKEQTRQIVGSKTDLERRFGVNVTSFAYPSGRYTSDTLSIVRKAGFTAAVTTMTGSWQSPSHIFTLRRLREMAMIGERTIAALLGK